jgi:hypothetical protein
MKKYLEIFVGSRGCLEEVEVKKFSNIEEYLEEERVKNVEGLDDEEDEDYRKEIEGYYDWGINLDGDYYLGLGDEEMKVYVDMECDRFVKWKEKFEIGDDVKWNKIEDIKIKELLEGL